MIQDKNWSTSIIFEMQMSYSVYFFLNTKEICSFIQADTKELVLKDWSYTNHVLSNWSADAWAPIHNKFHPNVFQLSSFNSSRAVVERIKQSCILLFPRLQIPSTNVTFRIWVVSSHVPTTPSLEFICRGYQLR